MRRLLCRADAVPEGGGRGFSFGDGTERQAVFVIRRHDRLYAYINECPHFGTPLDGLPDRFFDRAGEHLLCGTHGALFRPEDGFCVRGPCAGEHLAPLAITVADGEVWLEA